MVTASSAIANARVEPPFGTLTPSVPLQVKSATITFDASWSPYIQGTVVAKALDGAGATAADPRKGRLIRMDWSHTYAGVTTAMPLGVWLRSRTNDRFLDEARLPFASVESIMQDFADPAGFTSSTVYYDNDLVAQALADMRWTTDSAYPANLLTPQLLDSTALKQLAGGVGAWDAAESAWDIVQRIGDIAAVWYRGTESGLSLGRAAKGWAADTSTHTITGSDRVISATDEISRDSPFWANSVAVQYPNLSSWDWDYGTAGATSGPWKSRTIVKQSKRVVKNIAAPMAVRLNKAGRTVTVNAVTDLACRPNMTYRVQYRGDDWTGTVQSVTFNHPEGTMQLVLNVTES